MQKIALFCRLPPYPALLPNPPEQNRAFKRIGKMNNFDLAVMALTAAVIESLPNGTDYLTVKGKVMEKLRQDALEIRELYTVGE
jgi:hypothetical protein